MVNAQVRALDVVWRREISHKSDKNFNLKPNYLKIVMLWFV